MKKISSNLSSTQWFIILWLGGFLTLLIIAGIFRMLLLYI